MTQPAPIAAVPIMDSAIILALIAAVGGVAGGVLTYLGVRTNARAQIAAAEAKAKADIATAEAAAEARGPDIVNRMLDAADKLLAIRANALEAAERDLAELLEEVRQLRAENRQLIVQNAALISHNAKLEQKIEEVEGELRATREEIVELEARMEAAITKGAVPPREPPAALPAP